MADVARARVATLPHFCTRRSSVERRPPYWPVARVAAATTCSSHAVATQGESSGDDGVAIPSAEAICADAKALFLAADYSGALELYRKAAASDAATDLAIATSHSNAAACCLKLERLADCIEECDACLRSLTRGGLLPPSRDADDEAGRGEATRLAAKALFRRASARPGPEPALTLAYADLLAAARLSPRDAAIGKALRRAAAAAWSPPSSDETKGLLLTTDDVSGPEQPPLAPAEPASAAARQREAMAAAGAGGGAVVAEAEAAAEAEGGEAVSGRRFPAWIKSGDVPRFSAASAGEVAAAMRLMRLGVPVVLTGGYLIGGGTAVGKRWDTRYLVRGMEGSKVSAVVAPRAAHRRFTYYRPQSHEGDYDATDYLKTEDSPSGPATSARKQQLVVSKDFLTERDDATAERLPYLQIAIFMRQSGGFDACQLPPKLKQQLQDSIDETALEAICDAGGCDALMASQLFVAPEDALSPCHYDEQHNVFLQLRGRKSFLLLAPDHAAPTLSPFPAHHCGDRRARCDVEHAKRRSCRPLKGSAVEATLDAGDLLFLPAFWFHHVHALDGESISLSFWFARQQSLAEEARDARGKPDAPLWMQLRMRLAREVERLVADVVGPTHTRAFLLRLGHLTGADAPSSTAPPVEYRGTGSAAALKAEPRLQNWLLHRLATLVGAGETAAFLDAYLGAGRFEGLPAFVE